MAILSMSYCLALYTACRMPTAQRLSCRVDFLWARLRTCMNLTRVDGQWVVITSSAFKTMSATGPSSSCVQGRPSAQLCRPGIRSALQSMSKEPCMTGARTGAPAAAQARSVCAPMHRRRSAICGAYQQAAPDQAAHAAAWPSYIAKRCISVGCARMQRVGAAPSQVSTYANVHHR